VNYLAKTQLGRSLPTRNLLCSTCEALSGRRSGNAGAPLPTYLRLPNLEYKNTRRQKSSPSGVSTVSYLHQNSAPSQSKCIVCQRSIDRSIDATKYTSKTLELDYYNDSSRTRRNDKDNICEASRVVPVLLSCSNDKNSTGILASDFR